MLTSKSTKSKIVFVVVFLLTLSQALSPKAGVGMEIEKKIAVTTEIKPGDKKTEKKSKKHKKESPAIKDISAITDNSLTADLNALNTKVNGLITVTQTQQQLIAGQEAEINRLKDTVSSLKNNLLSTTGALNICKQEKEAWLVSDKEAKAKLSQQINRANEILKNIDTSKNAVKELTGSLNEGLGTRQKPVGLEVPKVPTEGADAGADAQRGIFKEEVKAGNTEKFINSSPVQAPTPALVEGKQEKSGKNGAGVAIDTMSVIFDEQSFMPLINTLAVTAVKTKQVSISQQGDFIIAVTVIAEDNCNASVKVFKNEKVVKQFNINVGGC